MLLFPYDENTQYPLRQHSALLKQNGNLLFFNNGFGRIDSEDKHIPAYKNYSNILEYEIDHENKKFKQVFSFGKEFGEKGFSPVEGGVAFDPTTQNTLINFGARATDRFGNPIGNPWKNLSEARWGGILAELDSSGKVSFQMNWCDSIASVYRVQKKHIYPSAFSLASLGLSLPAEMLFDEDYFNRKHRNAVKQGRGFKVLLTIQNNSPYALNNEYCIAFRYLSEDGNPLDLPTGEIDFGHVPPQATLTVLSSVFDEKIRKLDKKFTVEYELKHAKFGLASKYGTEALRIKIPIDDGGIRQN